VRGEKIRSREKGVRGMEHGNSNRVATWQVAEWQGSSLLCWLEFGFRAQRTDAVSAL
jgi:hypothetical protein